VQRARIALIETLPAEQAEFARPKLTSPVQRPVATSVTSEQKASRPDVAAALAGRLLWAGDSVDGLVFADATVQQIVTGYGVSSGVPFRHSSGIELVYGGPPKWDSSADYVLVRESLRPEMLYGFDVSRRPPASGLMRVESSDVVAAAKSGAAAVPTGRTIWRGILVKDGVYVAVEATSRTLLLDAAKQLEAAR
jgi:hypothetical protein